MTFQKKSPAFIAVCCSLLGCHSSFSQTAPAAASAALMPLVAADSPTPNPVWKRSGLPDNKAPLSSFEAISLNGDTVLALRTQASYGVLTHAWQGPTPQSLSWRWRLEQPLAAADIKTKAGDDAALKVCVMLDQPLADIPFLQRSVLALARSVSGQNLPSATLCYLWDSRYPAGTRGPNPYSARVRYIVLNGLESAVGQWVSQRRHVAEDFALLFGQESVALPPVIAVAVGADSDNTQGSSLGYVAQLRWLP
ncbi:MAG: DUF3047 domain-containing protein [Rhodoferax sp.]|nr:DUF3047 domain-containing protein [Rhodoferax sp.]